MPVGDSLEKLAWSNKFVKSKRIKKRLTRVGEVMGIVATDEAWPAKLTMLWRNLGKMARPAKQGNSRTDGIYVKSNGSRSKKLRSFRIEIRLALPIAATPCRNDVLNRALLLRVAWTPNRRIRSAWCGASRGREKACS